MIKCFKKAWRYALVLLTLSAPAFAGEKKEMIPFTGSIQVPSSEFSNGKSTHSLEKYRGKYVLVNFWATWCAPCVEEMPALDSLAVRLEDAGAIVVAINQDDTGRAAVTPFIEKLKISNMHLLYDENKLSFRDFGLRGLPTTILISPNGDLIARLEGSAEWDKAPLANQVESLISTHKAK